MRSTVNVLVFLPGVNSMTPLRNAYSLTLILSPLQLTRNIWIPSAALTGTPESRTAAVALCCRPSLCVKIMCNRLGWRVSTVSKSTESCTMPKTSSGAQLWRTSRSWSSTGRPRKQGTFFTNLKVFWSTSEAARKTSRGARSATSLRFDAQEQGCGAAVVSRRLCRHAAPLFRML